MVEGRLKVTVDGVTTERTSSHGPAKIPPGSVHALESVQGDVCIVEEWVDPGVSDHSLMRQGDERDGYMSRRAEEGGRGRRDTKTQKRRGNEVKGKIHTTH